MSIDPRTLKVGCTVVFGGRVAKEVVNNRAKLFQDVCFKDGTRIRYDDSMWEIAELVRPYVSFLETATMYQGLYHVSYDACTPEKYLKKLKQDVATLETVGVKEEE